MKNGHTHGTSVTYALIHTDAAGETDFSSLWLGDLESEKHVELTSGRAFDPKPMLGGLPFEIPEVFRHRSPITYAHNCTTPTLLIQGESDHRCPTEQCEQFYAAPKANSCIVEMLPLPHSSHTGSIGGAPIVRQAENLALLQWMDRYVREKSA